MGLKRVKAAINLSGLESPNWPQLQLTNSSNWELRQEQTT